MTYRILLSGGGTAGSVTPLIAIAQQIRRQHAASEFLFLGSVNGPERILAEAANIPFHSLPSGKLRRYLSWSNVRDLRNIWRGYHEAQRSMASWKPQVALSAGSYVSVPVIWAAHRHGIPTLVHQQDVRPGLANRLMAPAADVITVVFRTSARAFPTAKVRWTGNPVRPEVLEGSRDKARELFHLQPNMPVLLVLGGGTGSNAINSLLGALAYRLVRHWSVIHVTGPERDFVELHDPRYQRYPFLTWQLPHALAVADVVVCRAGLGTLSELAALGKPAIFIPLPETHQEDNAAVIRDASAGIVLNQRMNVQVQLAEAIERLRQDPKECARLSNNLRQFHNPLALTNLVDEVFHLIQP